jgi:hypothetical protein
MPSVNENSSYLEVLSTSAGGEHLRSVSSIEVKRRIVETVKISVPTIATMVRAMRLF